MDDQGDNALDKAMSNNSDGSITLLKKRSGKPNSGSENNDDDF